MSDKRDRAIIRMWESLDVSDRTVRRIEDELRKLDPPVVTNRNTIARVIREHKHALAVGIVAEDAVQITKTLRTLPPELTSQVSERNSLDAIDDMLVEMTNMVVGAVAGGLLQVRTVPEVAMMATAIGGLVTALTGAREAQMKIQAGLDAQDANRPPTGLAGGLASPQLREKQETLLTMALRRVKATEAK